jgi:DEAD/DEAH box helicase domain-containing protein
MTRKPKQNRIKPARPVDPLQSPPTPGGIHEYVNALKTSARLGHQVVHHVQIPEKKAQYADSNVDSKTRALLAQMDIQALYTHQYEAICLIRNGSHVVAATPTSSGKTLIYNLPVIERIMAEPGARALYLFPLKALAQDQLRTFTQS